MNKSLPKKGDKFVLKYDPNRPDIYVHDEIKEKSLTEPFTIEHINETMDMVWAEELSYAINIADIEVVN